MAVIHRYYILRPDEDGEIYTMTAFTDKIDKAVEMRARAGDRAIIFTPVSWQTKITDITNQEAK